MYRAESHGFIADSAFPTIREAKTFVEAILIQSGAIIGGTTKTRRRTFRGRISVQ